LLRAAITAALIGLLVVLVDFSSAVRAVGNASPEMFAAALALALAAWWMSTLKWWLLLRPFRPVPSVGRLYGWNLRAILYGQILPGMLAGEAVKGYRLQRETGSPGPVIVSIGVDKLTGLVALLALGSLALVRSPELRGNGAYLGVVVVLAVLVPALLLAMFAPAGIGWLRSLKMHRLVAAPLTRVIEVVEPYQGRYGLLLVALALSLLFQAMGGAVVYLLALGIDLDVSVVDLMWVYAAVSLVSMAPLSLGGLGAREAGFVLLMKPLGVGSQEALALALLVLGVQLGMALAGALLELKEMVRPRLGVGRPAPESLIAQSEGAGGRSRHA
jgi:uncharacterized protein (TIRG00374 family)